MLRSILLIITLLISYISIGMVYAGSITYIPSEYITMTGSNNDVRFDVKDALIWFDIGAPTLETNTLPKPSFTGAFYGSWIGWIMFSTGTYHVSLDCWIQSLDNLTNNCNLLDFWWNENIWEIDFGWVQYNPNTGLLEWIATSYAGNIDLAGIALPLKRIELNESNIIADSDITLSVSGAWRYQWSWSLWTWEYQQIIDTIDYQIDGNNWIYSDGVDLSLASKYDITITDPNGSKTIFWWIEIYPWELSTADEGDGYFAGIFCTSNSWYSDCPEGTDRSATSLIQTPVMWPLTADWESYYQFSLRARDKYGNRTGSGNKMNILYDTTVKNIQIDDNINYPSSFSGDAFISNKFPTKIDWTSNYTFDISNGIDINYTIASNAPTSSPDNIIQLNSVEYISGVLAPIPITIPGPLIEFSALYTASVDSNIAPVIGTPYSFWVTLTGSHPSIVPTIISTLIIGDGSKSVWKNLSSDPLTKCTSWFPDAMPPTLCEWIGFRKSAIATERNSSFTFTGTYVGDIANPDLEGSSINSYIYYQTGTITILYRGSPEVSLDAATRPTERIRLLGQSNTLLNMTWWENRIDLINTIRKNTTLLSRNRTNYNDVDYTITGGLNINIDDSSFINKRTIVIVGWDATITSDITNRMRPLSIIALTGPDGNGWNIFIDGTVKDIHSSLISERSIRSWVDDNQLYIRWLISSANTPQEIPTGTCPYYISTCTPSDFDLPLSRYGFLSLSNTTGHTSLSGAIYTAPLIIETDPRLMRDPPKIILK